MTDSSSNSSSSTKSSSADELAAQALGTADVSDETNDSAGDDETAKSDQVAIALTSLQNVIERNANELNRVAEELKTKRESLKNVFENDTDLAVAEQAVEQIAVQVKEQRAKMQSDPQVTSLKVQIGELNEQKKEIEETLSNHLVNYYQMTNSTSFDTSDGDQWEFNIRAKVKARKNSN